MIFSRPAQRISSLAGFLAKIFLLSLISLTFSCAVGPDFKKPKTGIYKKDKFLNSSIKNIKKYEMSRWWVRLEDPLLNNYVNRLLAQNLDILAGAQRLVQANENVRMQTGSYFPAIGLANSGTRSVSPGNVIVPSLPPKSIYQTIYRSQVTASWSLDLFGRLRRLSENAKSEYVASRYDQEALKHSLIAQLVSAKIAVSTNKKLVQLARKISENRRKSYDLIKLRYDLGAKNTLISDVYLAKESLASAKTDLAKYELKLAQESYKLDVLLGFKPGTIDPFKIDFKSPPPPLDVVTCLPIDLLDRRPDLKSSEFRIKAANANIGVAIADLYPDITLSGAFGVSGNTTNNIFDSNQIAGSFAGNVAMKIFEGGRLRANIKLQKAKAKELALNYSKQVLDAIREVEEGLKSENEIGKELNNSEIAAKSMEIAKDTSKKRYELGAENLKNYLDIEQKSYQASQNLLLTQEKKWNARISLILSLGGDWFGEKFSRNLKCGVAK